MKSVVLSLALIISSQAFAIDQRDLTLSEKCLNKITDTILKKYGANDETFSIVSTKLLYGGSKGGLQISPVVLVKTSDEVEPRDMVVVTSVSRGPKESCTIKSINVQADGLTVDMPDMVEFK